MTAVFWGGKTNRKIDFYSLKGKAFLKTTSNTLPSTNTRKSRTGREKPRIANKCRDYNYYDSDINFSAAFKGV